MFSCFQRPFFLRGIRDTKGNKIFFQFRQSTNYKKINFFTKFLPSVLK